MTDKRKKLLRSISKKTGVSHAGAANLLNRKRIRVSTEPFDIWDVFVHDPLPMSSPSPTVGGFRRADMSHAYEKEPEDTALVIGEEGEHILAVQKPKSVIVPLVEYRADLVNEAGDIVGEDKDHIRMAIHERMLALVDAAKGSFFDILNFPTIDPNHVEEHFIEHFEKAGKSGLVRVSPWSNTDVPGLQEKSTLVGFLDYIGIRVTQGNRTGLIAFVSRIHIVYVPGIGP